MTMQTSPSRLHLIRSLRNTRPQKSSLLVLARQQLRIALHAGGMSSTQIGGSDEDLPIRATVIALAAGTELPTAGPLCGVGAHVQVLQGIVTFHRTRKISLGWPGDLVTVGQDIQRLRAKTDTAILVTTLRSSPTTTASTG